MITKYIKGDILDTELRNIAHGVNCQGAMGSGVAGAILKIYPEVKESYHRYCNFFCDFNSKSNLLGSVQKVPTKDEKVIHNCFTQFNFGYDGEKYLSYEAIINCFKKLKDGDFDKLAIPKIGCGLAGGNWNVVEELINETTGDDLEVWVYEL